MKQVLLLQMLILAFFYSVSQVAINNAQLPPNSSAMLDVSSFEKGLLMPRMSSQQRNLIINPVKGLMVFDNTTNSFWFYEGTKWSELQNVANNDWVKNGSSIYKATPGNVGIGTTTPTNMLDIRTGTSSVDIAKFASTGGYGQIIVSNGTINSDLGSDAGKGYVGTNNAGDFAIRTRASNRVYIKDSTGNVGIGTSSPTTKLDVIGNIKYSGNLIMGLQYVSRTDSLNPGLSTTAFAYCPAGTKMIGGGGGFLELLGTKNSKMIFNGPDLNFDAWRISLVNSETTRLYYSIYVTCAKVQ